ncbi:AbrB/MazE/SpoVT family DNA-binding domain-containing protein [Candidatus Saccharibacteria bacterium]|nr:AbrB/MazE/SpoVT family DNA-binding domain-containing protein [Candidatus Saccharibacteria bacterium]
MKKTYQAKVSPQGQITLPKELRQRAGLIKGDSTIYISMISPSHIVIEPKPSLGDFYGSLQPADPSISALNVVEEIRNKERFRGIARLN